MFLSFSFINENLSDVTQTAKIVRRQWESLYVRYVKSVSASGDQFEPTVTEKNVGNTKRTMGSNSSAKRKKENVDLFFSM